VHIYLPTRPHATGHRQGRGYQCGACGLQGLAYGEPHYRHGDGSSTQVCEPAVPDVLTQGHPQAEWAGKDIEARAAVGPGQGAILERLDGGTWKPVDLGPPLVDYTATPTPDVPEVNTEENPAPAYIPTREEYLAAGYSDEQYDARFIDGVDMWATPKTADQPSLPGEPTNDFPPGGVPNTQVPPAQMTDGSASTELPEGSDNGNEHTT
jgi:hypothetical protein